MIPSEFIIHNILLIASGHGVKMTEKELCLKILEKQYIIQENRKKIQENQN